MKNNIIYILLFIAFIPLMIFRDFTPNNELRYLSIADEAIKNIHFFAFTNQGTYYADKPPLYFWLIMIGKLIFGKHNMFFLSMCSLIPAFITIRTISKWTETEIPHNYQLTGQLALCSCGLFMVMALFIRMDILMCMFITLALYTFYKMFKHQGKDLQNKILFPLYIFGATFSKGSIGILIPLISTFIFLVYKKELRSIGKYWGGFTWSVFLGCCILWFGFTYKEGGNEYLNNLLIHQTIDRAVNSFHHEEPFYYYGISIWYSLIPWSLLSIGIIIYAIVKRTIISDTEKFFFIIFTSTFILLSIISSKIDIYFLPAIPFIVYFGIIQLSHLKWNNLLALSLAIPSFIYFTALPIILILTKQERTQFLDETFIYIASGILSFSGIYALYQLYHTKNIQYVIHTLSIGIFLAIFTGGFSLPQINKQWGYGDVCRQAIKLSNKMQLNNYYTWGISRSENMDVYLNKDITKVTWEDILSNRLSNGILIIPTKKLSNIQKEFPDKQTYVVGHFSIIIL